MSRLLALLERAVQLLEELARVRQREHLHTARYTISGDALLTLNEAARLVGGRDARGWVENHVRIRWVDGKRRVLWRDVIAATADREEEAAPRRRKTTLRIADY